AGDHRQPTRLRHAFLAETVREQDEGIEVLEQLRLDRAARVDEGHLDAMSLAERLEIEVGIGRRTVGLLEVARERDAELPGHPRFLPAAGLQPARNLPIASARALWSTHTSPE